MVKDTKNKPNKVIEIDLQKLSERDTIKVTENQNYLIKARISNENIDKDIIFEFTKSNIESDLEIRLIVENDRVAKIKATIVIPDSLEGCNSNLTLNGLLLSKYSSINFTPSLEINNMNAGADHHSTIGTPNLKHLEYMQSRGITFDRATELIADSFLN